MIYVYDCHKQEDTENLAQALSEISKTADVWALFGTLGVGKSVFSRAFVKNLTDTTEVPSPTFTLVQIYESIDFEIYHYDLYRLKSPEEIWELNIEDAMYSGVCLIEWPEKMGKILPVKKILKIEITCVDNVRTFDISSDNLKWKDRLEKWNVQI